VIQETVLEAVHKQPVLELTANVPDPPAASTDCASGWSEKVQPDRGGAAAACVSVNVWPAMDSDPVRAAPPFGATEKLMLPLPLPSARDVIAIQPAWLIDTHEHSLAVVTVTLPVKPSGPTAWLLGEIANRHGAA
jgi:hypothetical protein